LENRTLDASKAGLALIAAMALTKLFLHLGVNTFAGYGIFRDELYYVACSGRMAAGYVDQPPLSIWALAAWKSVFGQSVFSIRFLPALLGAGTVFFTGLIVRNFGGGRKAVILACVLVMLTPIHLAMSTFYSMNAFDSFLWVFAAWILSLLILRDDPGLWLAIGLAAGLGLLNKVGFLWFGAGLAASLLLTHRRKDLATRWPYLALLAAVLVFLPYIIWNFMHDFAHVEFMRNAVERKYSGISRLDFLMGQLVYLNPVFAPVWICGLIYLLFGKEGRRFAPLGLLYLAALAILLINGKSKPEYLGPAYPMLFAGGAVVIEKVSRRRVLRWMPAAAIGIAALAGLIFSPIALPVLPRETFIRYQSAIGIGQQNSESKELDEMPQFFADMHGWENMAETVSKVYLSLPENERASCIAFGDNYGEAGAIDYYRGKYDLPRAVSGHNSYWFWGYGESEPEVVIVIGSHDLLELFESVEEAGRTSCRWCMPYEKDLPVYICRGLKRPFAEIWPLLRFYV
jgi:hypothetical protein